MLPNAYDTHIFTHTYFISSEYVEIEAGCDLGNIYMEASYPVDRVTPFAGTNERSVYMEPSYSAFISSTHCSYIKYATASKHTHALLAKVSPD